MVLDGANLHPPSTERSFWAEVDPPHEHGPTVHSACSEFGASNLFHRNAAAIETRAPHDELKY